MGSVIVGTGISVPDRVVTNDDLARIMDTDDEWIASRSGVRQRRFAPPGIGSSDLGADAVTDALARAGLRLDEVDALVTATMTPDQYAPGIAGAVQVKAGLGNVAVFDIRAQCAGFLYGLDLADMMITSGRAETVVVVGAEVHAGYLPWGESWPIARGEDDGEISSAQRAINDETRAWSVLFGDGAGAMVLQAGDEGTGILGSELHTDGTGEDLIRVRGLGFTRQPYADADQIAEGLHLPRMDGAGLFRMAVRRMPESVEAVLAEVGHKVEDLDLLIAHQANSRIVEAVGKRLKIEPAKVPMNLNRYGNTTAATIPLVYHEASQEGLVGPNALVAFTAFGAGAHWGAIVYQHPPIRYRSI